MKNICIPVRNQSKRYSSRRRSQSCGSLKLANEQWSPGTEGIRGGDCTTHVEVSVSTCLSSVRHECVRERPASSALEGCSADSSRFVGSTVALLDHGTKVGSARPVGTAGKSRSLKNRLPSLTFCSSEPVICSKGDASLSTLDNRFRLLNRLSSRIFHVLFRYRLLESFLLDVVVQLGDRRSFNLAKLIIALRVGDLSDFLRKFTFY